VFRRVIKKPSRFPDTNAHRVRNALRMAMRLTRTDQEHWIGVADMYAEECPFKVVRTNGGDEVLARAANLLIGRAAYETARRMYPKDLIEYRRGAQVLERSQPQ
jgi:hypothetical protein